MTTTVEAPTATIPFPAAVADAVNAKTWTPANMTWQDFLDRAHHPADRKDCGGYVAGRLKGTSRRKGEVLERTAVTLDADSAKDTLRIDVAALDLKCLLHSTFSHTPAQPRYRIIIPIDGAGLTEDEYTRVAQGLIDTLGRDQFDPGSLQPERLMFWPSTPDPDTYEVVEYSGEWATAEGLLRGYGGKGPQPGSVPGPKRDPMSLPGVPGAFNRAYSMAEAVEAFDLPYDPDPEHPDRWKYRPASSEAGLLVYPDGLVYSNHASDPAFGRALSVFDLVAIHKFRDLDQGLPVDVAPADRPSVRKAMDEFATDRRVVEDLLGSGSDGGLGFTAVPDGEDWTLALELNPKTGVMRDTISNWDLIANHDPVLLGLARNDLTGNVVSRVDLPWRTIRPGVDDALTEGDRAEISARIQREYRAARPSSDLVNQLISAGAQRRAWHPIVEYLESLVWDGKPRLEECLPGCEPTEYTRMVARRALVSAVGRVLQPGVKADLSLILQGGQGLGKTWWIDTMSRGWTCTLGPIGSKDTLLSMMRSWIVVADEGFAMKKADNDALKEFITRTHDVVRLPYARETVAVPRRQVIWGTTNDEVFLRAQEGNRRYLVVPVTHRVDFDRFTDEYVDQVWAEAVHLFRAGERLFLDDREFEMSDVVREAATEEDSLVGLIRDYVDTLVPDNWDLMGPRERRDWIFDQQSGIVAGSRPMGTVSAIEIWQIALGNDLGRHTRADILPITRALKTLDDWEGPSTKPVRVTGYGPQRVFTRKGSGLL